MGEEVEVSLSCYGICLELLMSIFKFTQSLSKPFKHQIEKKKEK